MYEPFLLNERLPLLQPQSSNARLQALLPFDVDGITATFLELPELQPSAAMVETFYSVVCIATWFSVFPEHRQGIVELSNSTM